MAYNMGWRCSGNGNIFARVSVTPDTSPEFGSTYRDTDGQSSFIW